MLQCRGCNPPGGTGRLGRRKRRNMRRVLGVEQAAELGLNERLLRHIQQDRPAYFEGFEKYSLMAFMWDERRTGGGRDAEVLIYLDAENLYVFCRDDEIGRRVRECLPEEPSNERALYEMFVSMLRDDMDHLEALEGEITDVEDEALESSRRVYLGKIVHYRKALLHLKRYYTRLDAIFDNLAANTNGVLSREGERLFSVLLNRNRRYLETAVNLRDYVTQMREAYQAQIDIEQNSLMKVFTVVTAISTPITVLTGWYGMNFENMPELGWAWSYPVAAGISAALVAGLLMLFRRRKWL